MQKIRIDFDNPGLPQHISAVENDSQSRFFQATLYENGKAYTAPEGAAYSIMYRGFGPQNEGWYDTINDGAGKRAACTASGNVVTCEIARQALQVPGHVSIVLCVTTGKGYMLKSWPIECDCKNDRYDSTVEIQSFFYITQVSNADWNRIIQALEELKNTIDPTLSLSGKAADAAKVGEAVGELKEDIGDLENLKYRELYYNLFYDFFAIATNKSGNITEYGNAQHIFVENVYSNGVKLESGNYLVALKLKNIILKRQVNVDARFMLCLIDGWSKKYLGDIQYYNGEKELFVYSVINFTNDNNIKVSPTLILDTGFEPNSEYSFDVDTIAIIKNNTNGLPESIFHYGNNKIYPVFDMYCNLSNFKNAYILNKKLVANDTSGTSDVSAQYTVAKMGNTVNKIMLKGIFDTNTTIAIITEPNGMTNVTDVTNRSIHITFGANDCSVGYFDNKALTNIKNISWDGDYIGKEVTIGFEISGNAITVYLPNGNTLTVTNEKLISCGGKYALWEHYMGGLNKKIFHSAQFTKIYAEDADGNVLCDDFNRENGSIGISPQGYVYAQFTNENQTGWSF